MGWRIGRTRRRNDNRIARKVQMRNIAYKSSDEQIDDMLRPYTQRAERYANRAIQTINSRKGQGKQLLISTIKSGIGMTARGFLGDPKNQKNKIQNPPQLRKTQPKKRRKYK